MGGLGAFTDDITATFNTALSSVTNAFPGPNALWWIGGTAVAAFLLLGRSGGAEYRYEKKKLRQRYQTYGGRLASRFA